MTSRYQPTQRDFTGCRVLILSGRYEGREGVCAGKSADGKRWAISPDGSGEILQLVLPQTTAASRQTRLEKEFGLLVDLSANPEGN